MAYCGEIINEKTYEQENNDALQFMLSSFYDYWKTESSLRRAFREKKSNGPEPILELFVTPYCNQACTYCYLTAHGNELYPPEIVNNKTILHNLTLLLDYYVQNDITYIPRIDLFSGEIWGFPLGNQVLDILLSYMESGKMKVDRIVIPTNASFVINDISYRQMKDYKTKFLNVGCFLSISLSYDGKIIDKINRPFKINYDKTQDQYEKRLRQFAKETDSGWHPMIDANCIEYQKDNYKWWISMLKEDYPDRYKTMCGSIMQLEVRSERWTKEKIISYLDWLNFIIDTDIEVFLDGDKEIFWKVMMREEQAVNDYYGWGKNTYFPYLIGNGGPDSGCSLGTMICVRLGDLAICPCHRTSYPKLLFGKYIIDNDQITGVKANNIPLANSIYATNYVNKPKCDLCPNKHICLRCCYGCNYEQNFEIFEPVEENCDLQKAKTIFLYLKYMHMYNNKEEKMHPLLIHTINKFKIQEGDYYRKWEAIIKNMNLWN